jgi:primosomal protein N' (replication factor Y)
MRIITVIPLEKGLPASHLSYFTKEELLPGAIVAVSVKNREILGLVTESRPAAELKSETRALDFSLKKIVKVIQPSFFLPEFMTAAKESAQFFATSTGQIIRTFAPKTILETPTLNRKGSKSKLEKPKDLPANHKLKTEVLILQDRDDERLAFYKSLIRETFAKKSSVLFCLPTVADIERTVALLEKGIGSYTIVLHSRLSKKEQLANWQKALESEHPILAVVTPGYLALPRRDFSVMIVDRENSPHYKDQVRPFADARVFIEELAKANQAKLVLGDIALRAETILRAERGDFTAAAPLKYRAFSEAKQELISTKPKKDELGEEPRKKTFDILSPELETALRHPHQTSERFFLLVGRRGLAPNTVCNDCGETISCSRCNAPVVLHARESGHFFRCHRCGQLEEINDKCPKCGSWRLAVLGLGIDTVETEIKKRLPQAPLFRLDSDTIKNPARAKKEVATFLRAPGSILLGTEMALDYLTEPVENTGLVGLDSLFSLPDFRICEKIMSLSLRTRALAIKRFFIQTRRPEEKVFIHALAGNLLDFFREEVAERQKLNYPPFSILIKITRDYKNAEVLSPMQQLAEDLAEYKPAFYETTGGKGVKQLALLIRQERRSWPNDFLVNKLLSLPPIYTVTIDPESLV